jgi:hypothetical protein
MHDQMKKFKAGVLSDDRINLLSDLQFDFLIQANCSKKVDGSHGNIKNLQVQERTWKCSCAKQRTTQTATPLDSSRKSYVQENYCTRGNPKFTLPTLKLLNELGIIQLPPNFKLKETTAAMSAKKK